jgi:hypothetical protein
MSGLTKKIIYADKALSVILGVKEGSLDSYSEISQGVHRYIKEKDLKNPHSVQPQSPEPVPPQPVQAQSPTRSTVPQSPTFEQVEEFAVCKDCGEAIPVGAVFCDMCGVKQ